MTESASSTPSGTPSTPIERYDEELRGNTRELGRRLSPGESASESNNGESKEGSHQAQSDQIILLKTIGRRLSHVRGEVDPRRGKKTKFDRSHCDITTTKTKIAKHRQHYTIHHSSRIHALLLPMLCIRFRQFLVASVAIGRSRSSRQTIALRRADAAK
jgi:hypothetical protein